MNKTTEEIKTAEESAVKAFKEEFIQLCEKHGVIGVALWTRKQTEKFDHEGNSATMYAAFLTSYMVTANLEELKAIDKAFTEAEGNIFVPLKRDIALKTIKAFGAVGEDPVAAKFASFLEELLKDECDCPACQDRKARAAKKEEAPAPAEAASEA